MIFMKSFSRNSLATGPKIRVPFGLLSVLITTAAFSSKRIYEPSARRKPFLAANDNSFYYVALLDNATG
jgi:hypothetical protein